MFRKLKSFFRLLLLLLKHHPIKTIWINFKCLPFKQAMYLPILLYGKTHFRSLEGNIVIDCNKISPFMIRIGNNLSYVQTNVAKTVWTIKGKLIFTGPISFMHGTYLMVGTTGTLKFGSKGTVCGSSSKIMCYDNITIGNTVRMAWNTQIYDTSFHYVKTEKGVNNLTQPIVIGDNVWIGNNSTITKGSVIPNWSIICSHSLVNKDLTEYGEKCMYAGSPIKCKVQNIERVFDEGEEHKLDLQFGYVRDRL